MPPCHGRGVHKAHQPYAHTASPALGGGNGCSCIPPRGLVMLLTLRQPHPQTCPGDRCNITEKSWKIHYILCLQTAAFRNRLIPTPFFLVGSTIQPNHRTTTAPLSPPSQWFLLKFLSSPVSLLLEMRAFCTYLLPQMSCILNSAQHQLDHGSQEKRS
jgi:hypothetical protein